MESQTQSLILPHLRLQFLLSTSTLSIHLQRASPAFIINIHNQHPPSTFVLKLRLRPQSLTSVCNLHLQISFPISSMVSKHPHQVYAMASPNTTKQAATGDDIFPFLDLPAELRNRVYQYTFRAPLGHLEIFDLLEPIPGGALLCNYTLIRSRATHLLIVQRQTHANRPVQKLRRCTTVLARSFSGTITASCSTSIDHSSMDMKASEKLLRSAR